jgi:hypothetical protein
MLCPLHHLLIYVSTKHTAWRHHRHEQVRGAGLAPRRLGANLPTAKPHDVGSRTLKDPERDRRKSVSNGTSWVDILEPARTTLTIPTAKPSRFCGLLLDGGFGRPSSARPATTRSTEQRQKGGNHSFDTITGLVDDILHAGEPARG